MIKDQRWMFASVIIVFPFRWGHSSTASNAAKKKCAVIEGEGQSDSDEHDTTVKLNNVQHQSPRPDDNQRH